MTLTEFLLARIAEDEQMARDLNEEESYAGPPPRWESPYPLEPKHLSAPAVLAECGVKRRIVKRYENTIFENWAEPDHEYKQWILPLLALPYADHPDYQQEWTPAQTVA